MAKKYKTLSDLAAAFRNGELKDYYLLLDNDCTSLHYRGTNLPDGLLADSDAGQAFIDAKNDECRDWYRGNGYGDLGEACDAAGIPNEWC